MTCHSRISTLFPYTTLFRSSSVVVSHSSFSMFAAVDGAFRIGIDLAVTNNTLCNNTLLTCPPGSVVFHSGRLYGCEGCISGKDRKSTRLNSSHQIISYAVFC